LIGREIGIIDNNNYNNNDKAGEINIKIFIALLIKLRTVRIEED
jgi:hypothetical protein